MLSFLNGYKTYIAGAVGVAIGVAELIGIDVVPNVDQESALNAIYVGVLVIFGRHAVAKGEVKEEA